MRPTLEPIDRSQRIPASYNQEERILTAAASHTQNNIVTLGLHLHGGVTADALAVALDRLVARHDALRLTFSVDTEGARLHVANTPAVGFAVRSVESLAPTKRFAHGLAMLAEEASAPFDVTTGPLIRAGLVRLCDTEHLIGIAVDHMIIDGRSSEILLRDLLALLRRARGGPEADLPDLPVQFPDWAVWERRHLTGAVHERLSAYWRTALEGITALPASGLADPACDRRPIGVRTQRLAFDGDVWARLTAAARTLRVSPFTMLSAVLKAAVYRRRSLRQPDDVASDVTVFGAVANRAEQALDDAVGYFSNSVVMRTDVSGDPGLDELVHRESRMLLSAMAHGDLPHPLVAREVSPELYGIRFRPGAEVPQYLNFDMPKTRPAGPFSIDGLRADIVGIPVVELPRSGLRLIAHPLLDGVRIDARYRTDRFTGTWIASLLSDYRRLLVAWSEKPAARLSAIAAE
ncbi:condensation domain-containing protein [Streptomyces nojiriensis]|uniref:condensation domain-containing protein n=1 Tax=Streptomyces nojiriensis TaxID=66374 RepID=UPI0036D776A4